MKKLFVLFIVTISLYGCGTGTGENIESTNGISFYCQKGYAFFHFRPAHGQPQQLLGSDGLPVLCTQ